MQDKWALEEHLSTPENNKLWDDSGEAVRNGKQYMDYVESHLLDVDERMKIMDATGIERTIVSLTSPGIQSITDTGLAVDRPPSIIWSLCQFRETIFPGSTFHGI